MSFKQDTKLGKKLRPHETRKYVTSYEKIMIKKCLEYYFIEYIITLYLHAKIRV